MTLFFAPISTYIHIFLRQKPFRELHRDVGVKNEGVTRKEMDEKG